MARPKKAPPVTQPDFKTLAERLQDALAKEIAENQQLTQNNVNLHSIIARQDVIIQYLESKFK